MNNTEMSLKDLFSIFNTTRPELFNHIYKECKLIYDSQNNNDFKQSNEERIYWKNEELNMAKAIIYDYGIMANKIGSIIVSATDRNI